jgi:hypothetical protein
MRTLGHWIVALAIAAIIGWLVWTSPAFHACLQEVPPGAAFYDTLLGARRCLGDYAHTNAGEIIALLTIILGITIWLMWRATHALVKESQATGAGLVGAIKSLADATQATGEAAKKSANSAEQVLIATQRPWILLNIDLAGSLAFDGSGASLPLKIVTENTGPTPAVGVLVHPVLFCKEKQPFKAIDVIQRRSADFASVGRLGHTLSRGEHFTETKTAAMSLEEYEGMSVLSPFVLVTVKYRFTFSDETHMTSKLFSLVRTDPLYQGQSVVMQPGNSVQPDRLSLVLVGSYAD